MSHSDLIPPSPSQEDFRAADRAEGDGGLTGNDPLDIFEAWFADAKKREPHDPNAVALATADETGLPDVRMVLLKDVDARGFTFYTNTQSAKGVQLGANAQAAMCFYWKSSRRQVRVRGPVAAVSEEEADAYFATRARDSRIGAWASDQSRPLEGRFALEKTVAATAARFGVGEVPRPPHWSGYRIAPMQIEFWRNRAFRLHERLEFSRPDMTAPWTKRRLFP